MMSSRRKDRSCHKISPFLFLDVASGEPMCFFMKRCPTRAHLAPIINAGGGRLCVDKEPNAILLANPEDVATVVYGSTATLYVSTQYIRDSVAKNEQLDLEDYRFNPEPPMQTRLAKQKQVTLWGPPPTDSSRRCFTVEDDTAILDFISKRMRDAGGVRVWKQMAKQHVTNHSWQSMKTRFTKHLSHTVPIEDSFEMREDTPQPSPSRNQQAALESDVPEPATKEDIPELEPEPEPEVLQPEHSPESGLPEPIAESKVPEHSPESEPPEHSPESGVPEPVAESKVPEHSPESEPPELSPESEVPEPAAEPVPESDNPAPETNVPKMACEEDLPPSLPPVESKRPPSPKPAPGGADRTPQQQQRAAQQRSTAGGPRRHSQTTQSPDMPSAKRARIDIQASEGDPEEDGATAPSVENADGDPVIHKEMETTGKKKTYKTRELGILEKASREFEESEDETPDLAVSSTASPAGSSGPEKDHQDQHPVPQTAISIFFTQPEAPGPSESCPPEGAVPGPVPGPVPPASTAHMFLFESESQEAESSQPIRDEVAFSQLQVEEVKRRLRSLMKKTNRDLESVTKALLRTSGDWSASLLYLMDGKGAGPFWDRHDDCLLLAGRTAELRHKYGEEGVAKRLAFLDTAENRR